MDVDLDTLKNEALRELNDKLVEAGRPPVEELADIDKCTVNHNDKCIFATTTGLRCHYSEGGSSSPLSETELEIWDKGFPAFSFGPDSPVTRLSWMFDRGELGGQETFRSPYVAIPQP